MIDKNEEVLYKTAVLAKEKGFNIPVRGYWIHNTTEPLDDEYYISHFDYPHDYNGENSLSAPHQSVLQKWLREVHGIHIIVEPFHNDLNKFTSYCVQTTNDIFNYKLEVFRINMERTGEIIITYDSFEDALQEGLKLVK